MLRAFSIDVSSIHIVIVLMARFDGCRHHSCDCKVVAKSRSVRREVLSAAENDYEHSHLALRDPVIQQILAGDKRFDTVPRAPAQGRDPRNRIIRRRYALSRGPSVALTIPLSRLKSALSYRYSGTNIRVMRL